MSKTSKRKSSESGKQSDNRNPSSIKDTSVVKRQSVFERLGTKATSSRASSERALSVNTSIPEAFCRSWALSGSCSHDKSCKLAHSHTLISPSKRSSIKKDSEIVHVSGVDKNRLVSSIKHQSPDVGTWDNFDQTELEYEDEKVLEKRRAALQRELELQMKKDGSRKEIVKPRRSSSTSSLSSTSSVSSSSSTSSRSSVSVAKKTTDKKRHLTSSSPESEKKKLAMKGSSRKDSPPRKMSSSSSRDQERKGRSGASSPLRQLQSRKRSISPPRKPSPKTKGSNDPYKGLTLAVTLKNDLALRAGNASHRKESPSSLRRGTSSEQRNRRSSSRSRRRSPVVPARPVGSRRSRPRSPSRPSTSSRARTPERKKEEERKKDDRRDRKTDIREKKAVHEDSRSRDKARELAREKERLEALERCRERQREREKEKDRIRDDRERKDVKRSNRDISRSSTVSSDKRHERAYDRFDRTKASDRDRSYDERERVRDRALERMMERKSVDRNRERSRDRYADRGNYSESRRILPPEEKNYSASPYRSGERSRYEPERERLSPRDERMNRSGYSDDRRDRGRSRGWPEGQQSSQSNRYDESSRERDKPSRTSGGGEWASDRGSDFQESGSGRSRDWESSRKRDEGGEDWAGYERGPSGDWHSRQHSHHHHIDDRRDRRHGSGSKEKDAHPPVDAAKNQDSMESLGKRSGAVEEIDEPIKRARLSEPPALEELSDISDDDDILNRVDPEFTEGEDSRMGDSSQAAMCDTSSGHGERTDTHAEDSLQANSPKLGEDEMGLDFEEISDEELEEESKMNKAGSVGDALGVDWASLMAECRPPKKKPEEAGENGLSSVRARWEASGILSRLSVSSSLASPEYLKKLREKFPQAVPGCTNQDQQVGDMIMTPGAAFSRRKKKRKKRKWMKSKEDGVSRMKKKLDEEEKRKQLIKRTKKKGNGELEDSHMRIVPNLQVTYRNGALKNNANLFDPAIPTTSKHPGGIFVSDDDTHEVEADTSSYGDEPPLVINEGSSSSVGISLNLPPTNGMADQSMSYFCPDFDPRASSTQKSAIATGSVAVSEEHESDHVPIRAGPSIDTSVSNLPPTALDDNAMDPMDPMDGNALPTWINTGIPPLPQISPTTIFTAVNSIELSQITTDLIINSIRQHPALWNHTHPDFGKRQVRLELLTGIASMMGMKVQNLRTKWYKLRLAYKKNYLKYTTTGLTSLGRNFEAMSFLECEIQYELQRERFIRNLARQHLECMNFGNLREVISSPTVHRIEMDEGLTQDTFDPLNYVTVEMHDNVDNSSMNHDSESGINPYSSTYRVNPGTLPYSSVIFQDGNNMGNTSFQNLADVNNTTSRPKFLNSNPYSSTEMIETCQSIEDRSNQIVVQVSNTSTTSQCKNPFGEASSSRPEIDAFPSILQNWKVHKLSTSNLNPKPSISISSGETARETLSQNRNRVNSEDRNSHPKNTNSTNLQCHYSKSKMTSQVVEVPLLSNGQRNGATSGVRAQQELTPTTAIQKRPALPHTLSLPSSSKTWNEALQSRHDLATCTPVDQAKLGTLHYNNGGKPIRQYHNPELGATSSIMEVSKFPIQRTGTNAELQSRQQSTPDPNRAALQAPSMPTTREFPSTPTNLKEHKLSNSNFNPRSSVSISLVETPEEMKWPNSTTRYNNSGNPIQQFHNPKLRAHAHTSPSAAKTWNDVNCQNPKPEPPVEAAGTTFSQTRNDVRSSNNLNSHYHCSNLDGSSTIANSSVQTLQHSYQNIKTAAVQERPTMPKHSHAFTTATKNGNSHPDNTYNTTSQYDQSKSETQRLSRMHILPTRRTGASSAVRAQQQSTPYHSMPAVQPAITNVFEVERPSSFSSTRYYENDLRSLRSKSESPAPPSWKSKMSAIGTSENLNMQNHNAKPSTSKTIRELPNQKTAASEAEAAAKRHAKTPFKFPNSQNDDRERLNEANEHFLTSQLPDVELLTENEFRSFKRLAANLASSILNKRQNNS